MVYVLQGVMPDGTSRFTKGDTVIYHFMGCSTMSEYSVLAEISCAKVSPDAPLEKVNAALIAPVPEGSTGVSRSRVRADC